MAKWFGGDGPGINLSMTTVLITVVISLVLFQAFGLIFGQALGLEIKLGPAFVLLPLGVASLFGVVIVKKMFQSEPIGKQDIFAIVVTFMIALLVMFFLRDFVPEIFSVQVLELQSMIGFN
jgi:hypothetical protein